MNSEEKKNIWTGVLVVLGVPVLYGVLLLAMVPFALLNAWIVQKLYIWFALPIGAPKLNVWHIWGLLLLIRVITFKHEDNDENKNKKAWTSIGVSVVAAFTALLLGYFIKGNIGY